MRRLTKLLMYDHPTATFLATLAFMMAGLAVSIGFRWAPAGWMAALPMFGMLVWPEVLGGWWRRKRFERMAALDDELLRQFYDGAGFSPDHACRFRNALADNIRLPAEKIYPWHQLWNGPFDRGGFDIWNDVGDAIEDAFNDTFGPRAVLHFEGEMQTVDDYIRQMARTLRRAEVRGDLALIRQR